MPYSKFALDGPANALAVNPNRDSGLCAVAGRTVFKVFSVDDQDRIVEKVMVNSLYRRIVWPESMSVHRLIAVGRLRIERSLLNRRLIAVTDFSSAADSMNQYILIFSVHPR